MRSSAIGHKAKPDILMIALDSFDGRLLDPAHALSRAVALPAMRNFTSQALHYSAAYSPSPQCVPARVAVLTGRRPDDNFAWSNREGLSGVSSGRRVSCDSGPYCELLARAQAPVTRGFLFDVLRREGGYVVRSFGKLDTGWEDAEVGEWKAFHKGQEMACPTLRAVGLQPRSWTRGNRSVRSSPAMPDNLITDDNSLTHPPAVRACVGAIASPPRQPWLIYCNLDVPHSPWPRAVLSHRFSAAEREVHLSQIALERGARGAHTSHAFDRDMSVASGLLGAWREQPDAAIVTRQAFYAACAIADRQVGEILSAASRHAAHALVVLWSDHGEMALEHEMMQKGSMFEASARVVLALRGPGVAAHREPHPASIIEIYPTVLQLAEIGASVGAHAPSLLHPKGLAMAVTAQYHGTKAATTSCMVRQGSHKLIEFGHALAPASGPRYSPQLFDVAIDPSEQNNLAKQHPEVVQRLRAAGVDCEAVDGHSKLWDYVFFLHLIDERPPRRSHSPTDMAAAVTAVFETLVRTCYPHGVAQSPEEQRSQLIAWVKTADSALTAAQKSERWADSKWLSLSAAVAGAL